MSTFNDFPLLPSLKKTLKEQGFDTPTQIQGLTLPALLEGTSVVGLSETGSGKTLSYVLPVLNLLKTLENEGNAVSVPSQPRAVIMVPTRELGEQVCKVFKLFTHHTRLRVRSVLGGTNMNMAKRNVSGCFEVLVATPNRIFQMVERGMSLKDVRQIVFDEADQKLDHSFIHIANRVVRTSPPDPQMILFSATISPVVEKLINQLFSEAQIMKSSGSHRVVRTLTTKNQRIVNGDRFPVILQVLNQVEKGGVLVFTNTKAQCDKLLELLQEQGVRCAAFRGGMDRLERRENLKKFTNREIDVLISTDLASRGLDFKNITCVINYHLPKEMDNYLHRVGRTARAGEEGLVINFVTERDKPLMDRLAKS